MPICPENVSRRTFVAHLAGAAASSAHLRDAGARGTLEVDPDCIVILNDTHVGGRHPVNSPIPSRLRQTVAWLLEREQRPAAVVVNGDLALNEGGPDDYQHFSKLVAPLREAGIPLHFTLGNHDNREVFLQAFVHKDEVPQQRPVVGKHVSVMTLPKANLFLLDSLGAPHEAKGLLGEEQRGWLAQQLDKHGDKPALIFAHHNPRLGGDPKHYPGGLEDSEQLWDVLASRPHVKAYVHGHIHHRYFSQQGGIHIIDTPAVGFVSRPAESTTGWTLLRLRAAGAEVVTYTHEESHIWNGARQTLKWR